MNQQKDNSGAAIVGLVFAALYAVGIFVVAVATFAAFALTILAIVAWNNPLRLGSWTLEPNEARSFVKRGIAGAFLVPAFVGFCQLLFSVYINWDYLPYLAVGGYVGGSIGIAYLTRNAVQTEVASPQVPQIIHAPAVQEKLEHARRPFEFASWDDEESEQ